MKITSIEVAEINKRFEGTLVSDSSLVHAENTCERIRSNYKCSAIWTRAIVIDHPFSDGNKRTALYVIDSFVSIKDQIKMSRTIERIAINNITDIDKIKELIKNANR